MVVASPSNAIFFKSPRIFVKNIILWLRSDRKISTNPAVFIDYLASHKLAITGRYHAVTMCLKNRIPLHCSGIKYTKISYLLKDSLRDTSRIKKIEDLDGVNIDSWSSYSEQELTNLEKFTDGAKRYQRYH